MASHSFYILIVLLWPHSTATDYLFRYEWQIILLYTHIVQGQGHSECQRRIQAFEMRLDTMHLIQRPRYQRRSPCQDPAGNRTTWRPPDHCKETQTAVVWSCLPFIRSDQNHLARHSERGKKTRQAEEEVGRQHQGMDRPRVCQVPEGSGEQGKMEETGCEIICGAPMLVS